MESQNTLLGYSNSLKFENDFDDPNESQHSYISKVNVIEDIKAVKNEDPLDSEMNNEHNGLYWTYTIIIFNVYYIKIDRYGRNK